MKERYDISIYLCTASEETHWKRAHERGMRHTTEDFKLRMARDFPGEHKKLLIKTSLLSNVLNMDQSLEKIIQTIKPLLQKLTN